MLGKHIKAYESFMQKLGTSMKTTVNHYNTAYKELGKIDKDVMRITQGERQIEPIQIEKPITHDQQMDSSIYLSSKNGKSLVRR